MLTPVTCAKPKGEENWFHNGLQSILFVFLILFCTASAALCQQTTSLSISVVDQQGAAIPFARVKMYPHGTSSATLGNTGAAGIYVFALPSGGDFLIEVDAAGFRKTSRTVSIQSDQKSIEEFSLEVAGIDSSIVVTASNTPQTVDQITKTTTVVGSQEILDRGEYTLAGILSAVPGVLVHNNGGPGQPGTLRVRGLRTDSAAVLIDGLRFRDAATTQGDASSFLSNLNFISADRVEIVRGSGSSLYGTNAASGVVNIISDQGGSLTHGTIQVEGGNLGFLRGRTQIGGGALRDRLKYSAGLLHLNIMRGVDGNDRARSAGGQAFLSYSSAPRTILSGRFYGSDDFIQANTFPSVTGIPAANIPAGIIVPAVPRVTYLPAQDDPDSRRASRFHATAVKLQQIVSSRLGFQASYQRVHTRRVYINGPAGIGFQPPVPDYSRYAGDIDTLDIRGNAKLSRWNQWTAGYEFEQERYSDNLDNNLPGTQRIRTHTTIRQRASAAYFQDESSFLQSRLQVSLSGRAQYFQLNLPKALTADLSLSYFTGVAGTKLRAHAGNAYRAPSLYERFGGAFFNNPATGELTFTPLGDSSLSPDRYNSVDGGIDQYLWRDRVRISSTYFYTRVVTITAFDLGRYRYINGSGGLSRGLELAWELRSTAKFSLNGSYTYTRVHMDRDITVPGFWRVFGAPRHVITLVATQRLGRRATVTADLTGNSEMFGNFTAAGRPRAYRYPGFTKADVSASYELRQTGWGSLKINTRIENVLNRTYYDLGWLAPRTTFVAGTSFQF